MGTKRSLIANRRTMRPALIGAGLLALLVILFFALLPIAHPPGGGRGSAFNPDNDVVVLKASAAPHRAVFERSERRDPLPLEPVGDVVLPLALVVFTFGAVALNRPLARVTPSVRRAYSRSRPPARAPPAR